MSQTKKPKPTYGFAQAGGLLASRVRAASSSRGFSETRILTQWAEIVGPTLAAIAQPAKVSYGRGGFGATLTVIARAAHGPELQMQLPAIRERVNACYGYNAISRVRITQVDRASGMSEPVREFVLDAPVPEANPAIIATLGLKNVKDDSLRDALERLSTSVLTRNKRF